MKNILLGILTILLISCSSQEVKQIKKLYNDLQTIETGSNQYYYSQNENSKTLIIYIEGSGLTSVLGEFDTAKFKSVTYAHVILDRYSRSGSLLIPEKPHMKKGGSYYNDEYVLRSYTVENLINGYKDSIDSHLKEYNYDTVLILGVSEGGLLLPRLYSSLSTKEHIDSLVIIGAGGLSQYDCFKIQSESQLDFPEGYRNELDKLDTEYDKIMENPQSISHWYLGWPYSRWSSFFTYTPLDYIKEITIPVLYIQGEKDTSSPVESVTAIENLSMENITIHYFPGMGHVPLEDFEISEVFGLVDNVLQKLRK